MELNFTASMDTQGVQHITTQAVGGQDRIQMPDQCDQNVDQG